MKAKRIYQLYLDLLGKYGSPEKIWPEWCKKKKSYKDREIIAIGAILTQRTSWRNADLALRNLKKAGLLSIKKIAALESYEQLIPQVRVAGFYQSKPKRLFDFCTFVVKNHGDIRGLLEENLGELRGKLLSLSGIGPETADTILLFALDKPTFIIDEYTKRWVFKYELATDLNYQSLKIFFEKNLPARAEIYQNFHALIIIDQKGIAKSTMREI